MRPDDTENECKKKQKINKELQKMVGSKEEGIHALFCLDTTLLLLLNGPSPKYP